MRSYTRYHQESRREKVSIVIMLCESEGYHCLFFVDYSLYGRLYFLVKLLKLVCCHFHGVSILFIVVDFVDEDALLL